MKFAKRAGIAFFVATLFSFSAWSFDIFPEYQGITAQDVGKFEKPADLDGEYQSYILAYQPGLIWEQWFAAQSRAVDTTVGSMTNQHFFVYSRAKFETPLTDRLTFRFVYFAQRDREIDQVRQFFELQWRFTEAWKLAAYMDPSLYKRENDIGVAVLRETTERQTRFYATAHDFTRNEHNDQKDFFAKSPYSFGWTETRSRENLWTRAGVRFDSETDWRRPQESRTFRYAKNLAFLDARWAHDERRALSFRGQWDQTEKSTDPGESWAVKRWQLLLLEELGLETEPLSMELGAMYASRHWLDGSQQQVDHQNIMPHALFKIRTIRRDEAFDHLRIGLTATDFHAWGPDALIPADQKRETIQGRLDTRYEWSLAKESRLAASLSFDLDEYSPTPTFEGGNVWFRTGF